MKKTLFFLSIFLLLNYILCSSVQKPTAVFDTDGEQVARGSRYYSLPVNRGSGGGLTLGSTDNESCPLYVAQEDSEVNLGLPLSFLPATPSKGVVRVSTDLNFKFWAATICVQSTVWKLEHDVGTGQYFVVSGGVEGNPGPGTVSNWFKIEKYDRDYKIVFCPTVCKFCKVICKDVGISIENGRRRLALSDVPLRVMFQKALKNQDDH